jgi:hypothetical protein
MGYAVMQASRRFGLTDNPQIGMIATAGQTWLNGAVLTVTSGLLTELGNAVATGWGVATGPFAPAITASGGTAIGQETIPKVGSGTAIVGPRRTLVPFSAGQTFIASMDSSGGTVGAKALAVADIGTSYKLRSVTSQTNAALSNPGGIWIVDAVGTGSLACIILALVDPPGATAADTPNLGAGNSGQALVEFFVPAAGRVLT